MRSTIFSLLYVAMLVTFPAPPAHASFHLMQIEQAIGGVDGDKTAQAIQLRMRSSGQNQVSATRLRAFDANGQNPILLLNIPSNVGNAALGARILIASVNFGSHASGAVPFQADFTLANLIPASYLAAGKITFENDSGSVLWSLAFGGTDYTGSNTGTTDNDSNGNFGAAFLSALPSNNRRAVFFDGAATDFSTNNAADYALTTGAAVFVNNMGQSFTVVPEPSTLLLWPIGLALLAARRRR